MSTLTYTEQLTVVHCTCGIAFAIPVELDTQAHDHKRSIYCPLGHAWHYTTSTTERLEQERRAHRATRDLLAAEERSHSATKGAMTKLRKRVEAGVCPHCHRHFSNLERHVRSKHAAQVAS
jgi:hypothetical protein